MQANVIVSQSDPAMRITLPKDVHYVGADRWVLYDIADCEIHVFVEADAQKHVRAYYWLQFEGFIPSRPELKHQYKAEELQKFAGQDTYVRARFGRSDEPPKAGSDFDHVQKLITAAGYTMPAGMRNVRLVRLLDPQGRKELMIIYAEDLAPTGVTVEDLMPGGKAADRWPAMQKELIEKLEKKIKLEPTTK